MSCTHHEVDRLRTEIADARASLLLAEGECLAAAESLARAEEDNARLRREVDSLTGEVERWQARAELAESRLPAGLVELVDGTGLEFWALSSVFVTPDFDDLGWEVVIPHRSAWECSLTARDGIVSVAHGETAIAAFCALVDSLPGEWRERLAKAVRAPQQAEGTRAHDAAVGLAAAKEDQCPVCGFRGTGESGPRAWKHGGACMRCGLPAAGEEVGR